MNIFYSGLKRRLSREDHAEIKEESKYH